MRIGNIYKSGLRPQLGYGLEVIGLSDALLHRARVMAAACLPPFAAGSSRSATFHIHGDPTIKMAVAAMLRWATAVWTAAASRSVDESFPRLRQLWEACRYEKLSWRTVRGPVGAARLEAARLGWEFTGPFQILTAAGITIPLAEHSLAHLLHVAGLRVQELL